MQRKRSFVRGLVAAMALLAAVPAAMVFGASPASAAPGPTAPSGCPTVQVDSAEVVRTTHGPGILVRGVKPQGAKLLLEAEDVVYVQQPEYWNYFVVGCHSNPPTVKVPYAQVFPVPSDPVGKFGITVNGIQIDLFPQHLPA
jgi:FlaG/FlaF family flagellin (archaellin)